MAAKFIVKRRGISLVVIEMIIIALSLSVWLCKKYQWDWVAGVLLFFGCLFVLGGLFSYVRIFRYLISFLFSLLWALLAYSFVGGLTKSTVSLWLATGVVFVISIALHKDYFVFNRDASRIEYEER